METAHPTFGLTIPSSAPTPIPAAIIAEDSAHCKSLCKSTREIRADCVHRHSDAICFEPDIAGVITTSPRATTKDFLAVAHPEIVEAWDRKKIQGWKEALQVKQSMTDYAKFFQGKQSVEEFARSECRVACDQKLLAGMRRHWGELRPCAPHPRERGDFLVCIGCLVAHHTQPGREFDRNVLMKERARVLVCQLCATRSVLNLGKGHRGCVCDRYWSCFRCREDVLEKLAKAKQSLHVEGKCGICGDIGDVGSHVEICLLCREVVVHNKPA